MTSSGAAWQRRVGKRLHMTGWNRVNAEELVYQSPLTPVWGQVDGAIVQGSRVGNPATARFLSTNGRKD